MLKEFLIKKRIFLIVILIFIYNASDKYKNVKNVIKLNKIKNEENNLENDDYVIKSRVNKLRYHFKDEINNRKLFNINYSLESYINISKNRSFEDNAVFIYNKTGMLNITKLELYIGIKNININNSLMNNIHISMSFDKKYTDLSLISIASILNTSNDNTYIHFHILGLNFGFEEIKKIIELRRINNRVNFIFYNAKQAEYDFKIGLKDHRGIGNYAKLLIPEIINNTNKTIIIDSGDTLCQKDLSELYFYNIGENYFGWVMDQIAGNYKITGDKFMSNNFHPNTGVMLVNIKKYKKDRLYKKALFMTKSYKFFSCPTQDILITISNYKFKFIPLKYNLHIYYRSKEEVEKKIRSDWLNNFLKTQRFSPYRYTLYEIYEAMDDPAIYHFYLRKIQHRKECDQMVINWINYAKLARVYEILKLKYPIPFSCEFNLTFTKFL